MRNVDGEPPLEVGSYKLRTFSAQWLTGIVTFMGAAVPFMITGSLEWASGGNPLL